MAYSGDVTVTPGEKIVQLPVAHAHNILPDMVSSGHVTEFTSGHFRSSMRNGPILHIYYCHVTSLFTNRNK